MKISNEVKVGAITYKVKLVENVNMGSMVGMLFRNKNVIEIDKNISENQQEIALIHEIFHALNGELTEETVDFLAVGWHQVLSENKILTTEKGKSK